MLEREQTNIIIPFGNTPDQPEREQLMHTVVKDCIVPLADEATRVVLVESGENRSQEHFSTMYCNEYIYLRAPNNSFGAGTAQNTGFVLSSESTYTYIHQADFLLPKDALKKSFEVMHNSDAPLVFPFFSSINLSKPLTEAVVQGVVDWKALYQVLWEINKTVKFEVETNGSQKRIRLGASNLEILKDILPSGLMEYFLRLKSSEVWGENDGSFTYHPEFYSVESESDCLVNYRPGPRAKASYLAKSDDYAKTGGPPGFIGWGPEDLGFWARVHAVYGYAIKDQHIVYKNYSLTTDMPLVHLWHSTSHRPGYYEQLEMNTKIVDDFIAKSRVEKLLEIVPLQKQK